MKFPGVFLNCKVDQEISIQLRYYLIKLKIKSVAYSSQGSYTGQLHFSNWLADGRTTG